MLLLIGLGCGTGVPGTLRTDQTRLLPEWGGGEEFFGWAVAGAGDTNGDGLDDVLIGAPFYEGQERYAGAVYHYTGSSGLDAPTVLLAGEQDEFAYFGYDADGAGDINGDGYADVVVGAPEYDDWDKDEIDSGAVWIFLGGGDGLTRQEELVPFHASLRQFGMSVSGAGDVDGDGHADVLVGEPALVSGKGRVYVFSGSSAGVDGYRELVGGSSNESWFGYGVDGAGDINGDGLSDVVVGAPEEEDGIGAVFVYSGDPSGIDEGSEQSLSRDGERGFGRQVAGVGDLNGDGYADIGIIAREVGDTTGSVYLYTGRTEGLSEADQQLDYDSHSDGYDHGLSLDGAGDIDGDGFGELLVGVAMVADGGDGAAHLYVGAAHGVELLQTLTGGSGGRFGAAVAGAGDVDGDGTRDLLVGAYSEEEDGEPTGAAYLFTLK